MWAGVWFRFMLTCCKRYGGGLVCILHLRGRHRLGHLDGKGAVRDARGRLYRKVWNVCFRPLQRRASRAVAGRRPRGGYRSIRVCNLALIVLSLRPSSYGKQTQANMRITVNAGGSVSRHHHDTGVIGFGSNAPCRSPLESAIAYVYCRYNLYCTRVRRRVLTTAMRMDPVCIYNRWHGWLKMAVP